MTGLAMALFVIVLGLTGALLAFKPLLVREGGSMSMPHRPGPKLSLAELAVAAERAYPHARTAYLFAPDNVASVRMTPRTDPRTGKPYSDTSEVVRIDPWTGAALGAGVMEMGTAPGFFGIVWDLHKNMALGDFGNAFVGYVALVWALDCLVGLYLTFPTRLKSFWRAWRIAWKVKLRSGRVRFNYDLHRASGLWVWPLLFLIAWSGVRYNNSNLYDRLLGSVIPFESDDDFVKRQLRPHRQVPKIGWGAGLALCRRAMGDSARRHGLTILDERVFAYISDFGVYSYGVRTSADFRLNNPISSVYIDGDTGELREVTLPGTIRAGNYFEQLCDALHLADFVHPAYRWIEGGFGVLTAVLSTTGVIVWWHKRKARRGRAKRASAAQGRPPREVMQSFK